MSNDTNWNALREERQALVERVRALPFDAAWREVRAALEASPSLYTDNRVLTIYEGPTRSFLLPLPFELLQNASTQYMAASAGGARLPSIAGSSMMIMLRRLNGNEKINTALGPTAWTRVKSHSHSSHENGFATIELPFVILGFVALVGIAVGVCLWYKNGQLTIGAWVGFALAIPFIMLNAAILVSWWLNERRRKRD